MDIQYDPPMANLAFRCSICGSGFFRPILVPRPDGTHYPTCFYECAGCSVMFVDPTAFNANEPGPPKSSGARLPAAAPSMSLERYAMGARSGAAKEQE
jgi:hypothetical protein